MKLMSEKKNKNEKKYSKIELMLMDSLKISKEEFEQIDIMRSQLLMNIMTTGKTLTGLFDILYDMLKTQDKKLCAIVYADIMLDAHFSLDAFICILRHEGRTEAEIKQMLDDPDMYIKMHSMSPLDGDEIN